MKDQAIVSRRDTLLTATTVAAAAALGSPVGIFPSPAEAQPTKLPNMPTRNPRLPDSVYPQSHFNPGATKFPILNVKDFGAVGDGVHDDTAAIQATIDFAYNHQHQAVYLPAGKYKTSSTLYLDAPGVNWRAGGGPNMTFSAFSLTLIGDIGGGANHEGYGTQILPTFNNNVALGIGPGRGMGARNLTITGPFIGNNASYHNGGQNTAGVGIGIPSGSAGTSRTYFENVFVENFYNGILTGMFNGSLLDDSNTFVKCGVVNCFNCWNFSGRENYINTLVHCQGGGTQVVTAPTGADVWVFGGNLSTASGWFAVLAITAATMSAITWGDPGSLGTFVYYFDITLGTETTFGGTPAAMGLGVYNAYAMLTTRHGAIPLFLYSWNSGTRVARFYINNDFALTFYGQDNSVGNTNLAADMAAQTWLYASERTTTFQGNNVHVHGAHLENPDIPCCVFDTFGTGVGGLRASELRNFFYNSGPVLTGDYAPFGVGTAGFAAYLVSLAHPFIRVDQGNLSISDGLFGGGEPPAMFVNAYQNMRLSMNRVNNVPGYQMRAYTQTRNGVWCQNDFSGGDMPLSSYGAGVGESDMCNYHTRGNNVEGADFKKYPGQHAWLGVRPNPGTRPLLRPDDADTLTGTLPAVNWASGFNTSQVYQLLWGGQVYHINHPVYGKSNTETAGINNPPAPARARKFYSVVSDHHFYTYGQTIGSYSSGPACSLAYQGQSYCVYADTTTLQIVFPGLGIQISDASANGFTTYVVTGVYQQLGYFTIGNSGVPNGSGLGGPANMFGVKGTPFTASSIGQEAYSIRKLDRADQINYQSGTLANFTLDNNDTDVILAASGTTATLTITMMPSPYDQDKVTIRTSQPVTTLTLSPNTGQSVAGNPSTLAAGALTTAIYRKANTTWYFAH
jgi:hypothetical protein